MKSPHLPKGQRVTAAKMAVVRENQDKLAMAATMIKGLLNANGQPLDSRAADEIESLEAPTRRYMAAVVNASSETAA